MITTQTDAKRFFVDEVLAQALAEGVSLTEAEREMLWWSESDPDLVIDPTLPERFEAETTEAEYEQKIAGLLKRGLEREISANPSAEEQWREASRILNEGDHYLAIMLDAAVGHHWKAWWRRLWM